MKITRLSLLIVALMSLSVMARADSHIERTLALASGGEFVLVSDAGSVSVTGSSVSGVRIVVTSNRNDLESLFNFDFEASDGVARVTARKKFFHWPSHLNLKFDVKVPERTRLSIRTSGGSVEISSLQGEQHVYTSGGLIDASDVRGNVLARTSGGAIHIRGVTGDADLGTSGGSIRVNSLNGSLEARTSGGPIRINGLTGRVSAHTSGGSIQAMLTRGDSQGGELETSGGSIRVSLDPRANLNIDAATSGGSISSDLPLRVQGKISSSSLHGTLGSGGPTLLLRASGGSIRITSS